MQEDDSGCQEEAADSNQLVAVLLKVVQVLLKSTQASELVAECPGEEDSSDSTPRRRWGAGWDFMVNRFVR
jgi:hypothetical protein